jgi:hypothetical protein
MKSRAAVLSFRKLPRFQAPLQVIFFIATAAFLSVVAGCSAGSSDNNSGTAPTRLAYPQAAITATAGQAISTDTPTVTGTATSYSVSPALPAGLSLNTTTGAISGTPMAVASQAVYTITATNSAGNTTTTVQILVSAAIPAPSNLAYPLTTITAAGGQAISADTPTVTGTVTSYSVSPALPAGLNLNTSTGAISGTPTAGAAQTTYTIIAANSGGSTTATVQITVIAPVAPTSLVYPRTTIVTSVGQTVPSDIPVVTGGTANYSVSPTLPAGLSLNLAGSISGAPTAASPQTTYTITASNFSGSTSASVTITVNSALPVLLDVGNAANITQLRVSPTRVLSQDFNNHWVLWDYASNTQIISGDQIAFSYPGITSWPVDMAGQLFVIGQTNGVDVRSVTDGHVVFQLQSSSIDSAQGGTWWKLATDGSYFCYGSQSGLTIVSATGQPLLTLPGNFSTAQAYAAPGQLLIALGPAGQNVIQTISLADGTSSVGPAFSGTFNSWFTDGQRFFSKTGTTIYTYSVASSLQSTIALPTIENLTGQGNWFWTYQSDIPNSPFVIYPVNSGTPAVTYALPNLTVVIPSANTIGVLPFGTPSASVIDLSGAIPVKIDQPLPIAFEQAYAATSASQWIVGNGHGVVLDGTTAASTPRYFGTGQAWSIAGGANYVAIATAIGKIYYFSPSASSAPLVGSINFPSSQVALSTDSTVMVAAANTTDYQYETDRTLNVYSLPSGTLTYSIPYQYGSTDLFNVSLSGSGTLLGQNLGVWNATTGPWTDTRQVSPTTGGAILWSDSQLSANGYEGSDDIRLSPDGTLFAVSSGALTSIATTSIYKNGVLVKTVTGSSVGWIDNNQLLVNSYNGSGLHIIDLYSGASIYDATGTLSSSPTLPEIDQMQSINSTSFYDPSKNEIFSLPSGNILYSSTTPLTGAAAVAGSYVVFASGSRIVVDTH